MRSLHLKGIKVVRHVSEQDLALVSKAAALMDAYRVAHAPTSLGEYDTYNQTRRTLPLCSSLLVDTEGAFW